MKKFLLAASVLAISTVCFADSPEEKVLNSLTHRKISPADYQDQLEKMRAIRDVCHKYSQDKNERRACIDFFFCGGSYGLPLKNPEAAIEYYKAYKEFRNS
jgi:hypothetical protein